MKNLLTTLGAMVLLSASAVHAQNQPGKTKLSAGILGAGNFTQFRIQNNPNSLNYKIGAGWAGGIWVNLPLAKKISFEPQFQYSVWNYVGNNNPFNQFDGRLQYQSLPLLFKYQASPSVAVLFGPQVDFLNSLKNDGPATYFKSQYEAISTQLTAGLELFPQGRVSGYARYMYGLSDMKETSNPNRGVDFYNQGLQVGLKVKVYEKKAAPVVAAVVPPPPPPPAPKDSDGDGVTDEQDKCPTVAGLAKYQGCPVPDTDKDGVNDESDKCPTVAGLARYQGCPIPDGDGDGVNDEEDKCPNEAGVASNFGCPDMSKQLIDAARSFYFQSGTAKLANVARAKAKIGPLMEILKKYPNMHIDIEGHTDNTGSDKINQPLSQKRADAVKNYLVKQGFSADRFTATGFGSSRPVADNKTKEGRAVNRRTVLVPKFVN